MLGKLWNQGVGKAPGPTAASLDGAHSLAPSCLPQPLSATYVKCWLGCGAVFVFVYDFPPGRQGFQLGLGNTVSCSGQSWLALPVQFGRQALEGGGSLALAFIMKPWGHLVVGFTCWAVSAEWSLDHQRLCPCALAPGCPRMPPGGLLLCEEVTRTDQPPLLSWLRCRQRPPSLLGGSIV